MRAGAKRQLFGVFGAGPTRPQGLLSFCSSAMDCHMRARERVREGTYFGAAFTPRTVIAMAALYSLLRLASTPFAPRGSDKGRFLPALATQPRAGRARCEAAGRTTRSSPQFYPHFPFSALQLLRAALHCAPVTGGGSQRVLATKKSS